MISISRAGLGAGVIALSIGLSLALWLTPASGLADEATLSVYKTPTCGCCTKWIEHLEAAGFRVEAKDLQSLALIKASNGVPRRLASCHTALIGGYVIEGHVPAGDIARLLEERPDVSGLAVPGMPLGSPGMEHPDPRRHETYEVLAFGADGRVSVFARHAPGDQPGGHPAHAH